MLRYPSISFLNLNPLRHQDTILAQVVSNLAVTFDSNDALCITASHQSSQLDPFVRPRRPLPRAKHQRTHR